MRGDFSRLTFNKDAGYTQVLFQQGQDLLESEFNEQAAILRDQIRATGEFAALIQRKAGPQTFEVTEVKVEPPGAGAVPRKVTATFKGSVFVPGFGTVELGKLQDGMHEPLSYQFADLDPKFSALSFVLETSEEPVRADAGTSPPLADPALAGGNAALRLRPIHRIFAIQHGDAPASPTSDAELKKLLGNRYRPGKGALRPVLRSGELTDPTDECAPIADERFQGVENQLYRVEIHAVRTAEKKLELKMSRDNASVAYRVDKIDEDPSSGIFKLKVHIAAPSWPDDRWAITPGITVELLPAATTSVTAAGPPVPPRKLLTVEQVDVELDKLTLVLTGWTEDKSSPVTAANYPCVLRWDHAPSPGQTFGGLVVDLSVKNNRIPIEDDLWVQFDSSADDYEAGDYWFIPVRLSNGEALWPRTLDPKLADDRYEYRAPNGPHPAYTPLALVPDLTAQNPSATLFPWSNAVLKPTTPLQPTVVVGTPGVGGALTVGEIAAQSKPIEVKGLDDNKLPVQFVFSVRQLLVFLLGDKGDPLDGLKEMITPPDLAEAARRLSIAPAILTNLIVTRVNKLLHKDGLDEFLKSPHTPADLLAQDGMDVKSIDSLPDPVKDKLKKLFTNLERLANNPSAEDVLNKIMGQPSPVEVLEADKPKVKAAWHDAKLVQFYVNAWPFETIAKVDWPTA